MTSWKTKNIFLGGNRKRFSETFSWSLSAETKESVISKKVISRLLLQMKQIYLYKHELRFIDLLP